MPEHMSRQPVAKDATPVEATSRPTADLASQQSAASPVHARADPRMALRLQRVLGNRAVTRLVAPVRTGPGSSGHADAGASVQRVEVPTSITETLLQVPETEPGETDPTAYEAREYTLQPARYQLTRTDAGFTVEVRINFQDPSGRPITDSNRRSFATSQCGSLTQHWNERFDLLATRTLPVPEITPAEPGAQHTPAEAPTEEVRLPLTFTATPIFDPNAESDTVVYLHAAVATGEGGAVLDSQNWYTRKSARYPATFEAIYAHEFGHLLGIPDEYSRDNADMHVILHEVAGGDAEQGRGLTDQLDQQGIELIVLQALRPHLITKLQALGGQVNEQLLAAQPGFLADLTNGAKLAWADQAVHETIATQLLPLLRGARRARSATTAAVDAATGGAAARAEGPVNAELTSRLTPGSVGGLLGAMMGRVVDAALGGARSITLPSAASEDVNVRIQTLGVEANAALAAEGGELADTMTTGGAAGTASGPGLAPSNTVVSELDAITAHWSGVSGLMAPQAMRMPTYFAEFADLVYDTDMLREVVRDSATRLRAAADTRADELTRAGAARALRDFLDEQLRPVLQGCLDRILACVRAEAQAHTTATGTGTNATHDNPVDAQLAASVRRMVEAAAAMQASETPGPDGGPNVRYTVDSLMGNNVPSGSNAADTFVRADNIAGIVAQVNTNVPELRRNDETAFEPERVGS